MESPQQSQTSPTSSTTRVSPSSSSRSPSLGSRSPSSELTSSDPSSAPASEPKALSQPNDDVSSLDKGYTTKTYGPYSSYSEQLKSQLLYPIRIPGRVITRFKNRNAPKPETRSPTKLHDPVSFPPPPPSVLIANPGIVDKRRAHFMKPRNKLVRKAIPPWPLDVFYDYQQNKYAIHLRNARPHRLVGKVAARKSRKQAYDNILQPRMDDTPLQSIYRMYEYIVIDSRKAFYSEVEYFYNQTDWIISDIPDPRYTDDGAEEEVDNDPERLAVLAVTVKVLVNAFNALHKYGMRRTADISIDGKKATPCAIRFYQEELPAWIDGIQPLPERTFFPHGDACGDTLLSEDDKSACLLFWEYNIVRRRVQVQFHLYTRDKKFHRPSKKVVEDFGKDTMRTTVATGVAVGHAAVKTGVGIKDASVEVGEFAEHRGKAGVRNTKRTVKVLKSSKARKKVVKKVWHVWMDGKYKKKVIKATPAEDGKNNDSDASDGNEGDNGEEDGEENEGRSEDDNEEAQEGETEPTARRVKVLPKNVQIIPDKNGKTVRKVTKLEKDIYLIEIR